MHKQSESIEFRDIIAEITSALNIHSRQNAIKKIFWEIIGFDIFQDEISVERNFPKLVDKVDSLKVVGRMGDFRLIQVVLNRDQMKLWGDIKANIEPIFNLWNDAVLVITDSDNWRWHLAFRAWDSKIILQELFAKSENEVNLLLGLAIGLGEIDQDSTLDVSDSVKSEFDNEETIAQFEGFKRNLRISKRMRTLSIKLPSSSELWIADMGSLPLLTVEEEKELFENIQKSWHQPREDIFPPKQLPAACMFVEKAICHNGRLVWSIATKYQSYLKPSIDFIDLLQEGMIGLMHAIKRYNPDLGYKFSTYAVYWIKQKITRHIADYNRMVRVPVYLHDKMIKASNDMRKVQYGEMTEEERLKGYSLTEEQEITLQNAPLNRVDYEYVEKTGCTSTHRQNGEYLINGENVIERILKFELQEMLRECLLILDKRAQRIIEMCFGLNENEIHTLDDIGKLEGVTRERIRQIKNRALQKMKEHLSKLNFSLN